MTGESAPKPEAAPEDDLTIDLEAFAKRKPLLVYYFVKSTDPNDENYSFSRKFELSVLQDQVVETINKNYTCKKVELPLDGDMKKIENQARLEVWSVTGKKLRVLGRTESAMLNRAPFLNALKVSAAKNERLVTAEIERIQKVRKAREEKAAKAAETAKTE